MKIKKIFMVTAMITAISLSLASYPTVYAESKNAEMVSGDYITSTSLNEYQEYLQSLPKEMQIKVQEKHNATKLLSMQPLARAATATKVTIPGTFSMYRQLEDNYCVPACVQSALGYINSSTPPTQAAIARAMGTSSSGTDRTKIPEYMNSQQSKCLYIINTNTTQTSICTAIYNTITNDKVPTFMSIENTTGSNWYYSTSGHCLINNGIYSDYSKILFSDPLGGTQAGYPTFFEKDASVVAPMCKQVVY
ncbi:MAG: C39 family peptidase [Oscillospiraceae bacterium]|nr:C39 family peptidase [Oscillospiraceae bacterium]